MVTVADFLVRTGDVVDLTFDGNCCKAILGCGVDGNGDEVHGIAIEPCDEVELNIRIFAGVVAVVIGAIL